MKAERDRRRRASATTRNLRMRAGLVPVLAAGLAGRPAAAQAPQLPRRAGIVGQLIVATSALNLVFLVWFGVGFATVGGQQLLDLPRWILALLCLPLVSVVATLTLLLATTRAVLARRLSALARAWAVSYAALACAFLLWLQYWNLIGFHV